MSTYAAFVRGQGSFLTSPGIDLLAADARRQDVVADVFNYSDWVAIEAVIRQRRGMGDKVAVVGYSLGDSTGTYLGTRDKIDLLICIFESSFAANYPPDHDNVGHSVLFHGPGALSDADVGRFDEVIEVPNGVAAIPVLGGLVAHLAGQFSPIIVDGVLQRLAKL